ncbi:hypothetical protein GCK72_018481 [Caenorhabditis remanei]|uniref:Uncharacterized protein n=1 Tax=Caenorhabditis remanei TaxID=31234 RepID=A0A6A5G9V7_CAERE|nr:hypothetical protein GCK72_018481 [Caenorhabditis remanei]KAF1751927.1 hypothetical protein GCK72_018481 [Caenorhabditis remanei]
MYSVKATEMSTNLFNCSNVMLRNHYIVTVNVDKFAQKAIGVYYALLIIIESLLFATLLVVHFKIRKGCHPFFGGCVVSAVVTVIIIGGCIGLYFLNRNLTLKYQKDLTFMGKVSLSMRYQIIENMIVVRKALLPVIVLDSLVTLVDSFSSQLTTRIEENDDSTCHSLMKYAPYIALNHLAMVLEYSIPLYMLFRRAYRRQLPDVCRKLRLSTRIQQSRDSMIQNVFGRELNVIPTQNEYFENLQKEWK